MSPPCTRHSVPSGELLRPSTYDGISSFPLPESGLGLGEDADHASGPNTPPSLDDSQSLQEANPAMDQESGFLDDATLLRATVSAEQQLRQSQGQNK